MNRLHAAWHVLRGRSLIYNVEINKPLFIGKSKHLLVKDCHFDFGVDTSNYSGEWYLIKEGNK